jgi:hypothetical protein
MIRIGSLDRLTAVIGRRGVGKSEYLIRDANEFRREARGGYIIGHSPGARLPSTLHDGTPGVGKRNWHDSIKSLERGLSRDPNGIHIVTTGDPEDVIDFGRGLSKALRRKAIERAGWVAGPNWENRPLPDPKIEAEPVLVLVDEGVALKEMFSKEDLKRWKVLLTGLRHENLAITWGIQSPTAKNWVLIEQSNRLVAFNYQHEWGLNAVRAWGVPQEDLQTIRNLQPFHRRIYRPGEPPRAENGQ